MLVKIALILSTILLLPAVHLAQEPAEAPTVAKEPDSPAETDTSEQSFKPRFAAIPIVNYDPSFEWNLAAMANVFFKPAASDTISPLSMAGAILGYTTNGSWYWAAYTKLYLDQDNYRTTLAYGDASINFQYYDELATSFVGYNSLHDVFYFEGQRRVYNRWFLGARYVNLKTKTKYEIEGETGDPAKQNMNNMGFVVSHDTRDNIYNPYHGDYMNLKTGHYFDALGSDFTFDKYEFDFTKFININDQKVVAARFAAFIAAGDVPFEGQFVVGRDDIRGYSNGKHRANQVYDIQAEYRWNFYKKWGAVAFGGIATAVDKPNEITWDGILPAAGVGIRYKAVPTEDINIGIDVAVGKDDWGIYFRIGEAFGDK